MNTKEAEELEEAMEEDNGQDELEDSEQRVSDLLSKIESQPYDYDSHIELIRLLRQSGELEALRQQREAISQKFCMPGSFWLEWIEDEKQCESEKEIIQKLFERAVEDFHSPDVYIEYVQWACGVSVDFAREKMEEAVGKIGLRADCASILWNVYLDFEKMVLSSLSDEKAEKQRAVVESLYSRFLRIPHIGMDESWKEYATFTGDNVSDSIRDSYSKALKRMPEITEFEDLLQKDSITTDEELAIFSDYIELEKKEGDPVRVQMMFERALASTASTPNANLWLQYGSWLDSSLKIHSIAVKAYERSVRHAPCTALWQQYLSALERAGSPAELIDSKWLCAKETITTQDEGFSLYRTYIYLLRRRAAQQDSEDYSRVKEVFDEGANFLMERFGTHWDSPKAQYRKNHALFLYTTGKQPDKARKIWNDILASGSGHLAAAWIEAAFLERFFGSVKVARKLLYRAINSVSDHPYTAFDALIQFEREEGTLEELDKALEKVNAQAMRVAARPQKKQLDESRKKGFKGEEKKAKDPAKTVEDHKAVEESSTKVPKRTSEINGLAEQQPVEKKPKRVDEDGFAIPDLPSVSNKRDTPSATPSTQNSVEGSSSKTVFISNLDFKLPKERIQELFPEAKEVRLVYRGMSKLHKGFGYVDFENEEEARKALSKDRQTIDGRPIYVSEYKPHEKGQHADFRYATGLEKNKVFVNNVHYDASAEQLKELFSTFGVVRDARVVTHKSGKSKGCAYVEFEDESAAAAAIKATDLVLLERKLSVALSNPPKKKDPLEARAAAAAAGQHRNKIELLPRAVSRNRANATEKGKEELAPTKLSNDQFRSFLKK